ncbi:MAG: M61 family metallopeptidase [Proteobacteria bacterium]|nr:M61 family metallopeptidase [Pseudomonadota bacterium]
MRAVWLAATILSSTAAFAQSAGPSPVPMPPEIPAPKDVAYPGTIKLAVDATDTTHGIFRVHETIPVPANTNDFILLYPEWLPGNHSASGPINKVAGLVIKAGGKTIAWKRDPVHVYAFHVPVPKGATAIDVDFQFLSATDHPQGRIMMTPAMLSLQWNTVALYPAGYYSRDIKFTPSVKFPAGWHYASALTPQTGQGNATFATVPFNTLVDSPMIAGRNFARVDLDPSGKTQNHLDVIADKPGQLKMTPQQIQAHRNLVAQAYKAFGSHHYDHYDFLFSLSDHMGGNGLEHHQSSEDGVKADYFTHWDKTAAERDLLAHEFTHSWNGKFRRPADLWTPNFNVPMRDSLLWVYEGQTQFWGYVLATRAGLWNKQMGLDALADVAAVYALRPGRKWRNVADTTNDPIIAHRAPAPWRDWQRSEDYYSEGQLVWTEVDMTIRQKTNNAKSIDDFAKAFFGVDNGSYVTVTYTFDDVVKALNSVVPYDWAKFLRARIDGINTDPLGGIRMGGYKLTFTDKPSGYTQSYEKTRKLTDLLFSLGVILDKKGAATEVMWDGPAMKAGLTVGAKIVAVNGEEFDADDLKDAITDAKTGKAPIQLLIEKDKQYRTVTIDYHGGLRYPHLERVPGTPALLDDELAARK